MKIIGRIMIGAALSLAVLAGLGVFLLYTPTPDQPALRGKFQDRSVKVGGRERTYRVFSPARAPSRPALVVVFHGSMGSPEAIRVQTGFEFDRLAEGAGFIVAYPQGYQGYWNDCRTAADYAARRLAIDDLDFFEAIISDLQQTHGIDPDRVFVVGASAGGHMVYRLALERPRRLAGAAVFAASLPTPENLDCAQAGAPPPVMIVNGTRDPINPYQGGDVTLFGMQSRGAVRSARASAAFFARARGSQGPRVDTQGSGDFLRAGPVERMVWRDRNGRADVVLLSVIGGGHVIPQPVYRPRPLLGRSTRAINGPSEAWRFFDSLPRRSPDLDGR
ncbi:alpha/beta hydrolase family esterase [Methylomagnum sp.]